MNIGEGYTETQSVDKPKFVAFFLFVCMAASFIAQISSFREISSFRLLAPVAKQWIAKDIPSYWSQSKRTKIAIHVFGKYWKGLTSPGKNCNLRPKPWKCRSYWKLPFLVSHPFCMLSVAMHILTLQRKREIRGCFNYIFATPGSCEVKNGQLLGCPEMAACLKNG